MPKTNAYHILMQWTLFRYYLDFNCGLLKVVGQWRNLITKRPCTSWRFQEIPCMISPGIRGQFLWNTLHVWLPRKKIIWSVPISSLATVIRSLPSRSPNDCKSIAWQQTNLSIRKNRHSFSIVPLHYKSSDIIRALLLARITIAPDARSN